MFYAYYRIVVSICLVIKGEVMTKKIILLISLIVSYHIKSSDSLGLLQKKQTESYCKESFAMVKAGCSIIKSSTIKKDDLSNMYNLQIATSSILNLITNKDLSKKLSNEKIESLKKIFLEGKLKLVSSIAASYDLINDDCVSDVLYALQKSKSDLRRVDPDNQFIQSYIDQVIKTIKDITPEELQERNKTICKWIRNIFF